MQLSIKKNPEKKRAELKRASGSGARDKSLKPTVKAKNLSSGGGNKQFVIFIGDEGAILVFIQKNRVVRRLFAPSAQPAHTEAMLELMSVNPNVPVVLLMDVIDQQYVRQSFPPVSSLSVKGLVERRLARDFQADDLKGSLPLGRDKTGRKEWNFLLISLAKTPLVSEWLDLIIEMPNRLQGIYLSPVESMHYLAQLRKAFATNKPLSWQMLVSHNKISGFRQVVFRDGRLVFTRVTQAIDDAVAAVIAGNIEQEITSTIEYLRRLGFQETSGLEAYVIVSQDVAETLDLKRFNFGAAFALTPLEVSEGLKLEQAALTADRFGDVVMTAAFARAPKRSLRLSTVYLNRLKGLYAAKKAIALGAILISLALIGASVSEVVGSLSNASKEDVAVQKQRGLQPELLRLKKTVAELNKDISFKAAVVSTHDVYFKTKAAPYDIVRDIAPVLTSNERVISMVWERAPALAAGKPVIPSALLEIELKSAFEDVEALSKVANGFVAQLKTRLQNYDVVAEPFPWLAASQSKVEISFDQQQISSPIKEGWNTIKVRFDGPKKSADASTQGAAP